MIVQLHRLIDLRHYNIIINNNNITPDHTRRKIREHEGLQRRYAVELREMLTRLGPSFIKFGQVGRDH